MKEKNFHFVKVVSRNIITDFVQGIRNFLGLELKSYSEKIDVTIKELLAKAKGNKKWYKIDVDEIGHGGIMIIVYGVYKWNY